MQLPRQLAAARLCIQHVAMPPSQGTGQLFVHADFDTFGHAIFNTGGGRLGPLGKGMGPAWLHGCMGMESGPGMHGDGNESGRAAEPGMAA